MKNESYKSRDTQHLKSLILGVEFKGGFANLTGLMLTLYSVMAIEGNIRTWQTLFAFH